MDGSSQMRPGGVSGGSTMSSRAQRFEDEKQRISDSCFSKLDEVGALVESYITHLRIIEDAAFPSSPPPPNSSREAKKPRLIIIAVRKSGRVRIHKARENSNGSFSIGKTWPLDELSTIRSYTSSVQGTVDEERQKQWAGGIGFAVTLGKAYYWQANTQTEKHFFIASLVKIFTKYTGGRLPDLVGFNEKELGELVGPAGGRTNPVAQQLPPSVPLSSPYSQPQNRGRAPSASREPALRQQSSRDPVQRAPPIGLGTSSMTAQSSRPQDRLRRDASPSGSMDSSGPGAQPPSLRRLAGSNQSQDSLSTRSDDTASLPPRSRGGINGTPSVPGSFPERSTTPNSQRALTPEAGFGGVRDKSIDIPPVPAPLAIPPERRRPPMPPAGDLSQRSLNSNESFVPAPLVSPSMRRDESRPSTHGSDRSQTRLREDVKVNNLSAASNDAKELETTSIEAPQIPLTNANKNEVVPQNSTPESIMTANQDSIRSTPSPVMAAQQVKLEEEESRPGLGPMIKKKSKADVANTFLRAAKTANAFSAFVPRAGGAAERLREAQSKPSDGPDGISGVVPAPSLLRGMTDESNNPASSGASAVKPAARKPNDVIPEVKITVPQSNRPSSVEGPVKPSQKPVVVEKPKVREVKRQRPPAEIMAKEIRAIGVDPAILGDRGGELLAAWEEYGFTPGEGMRNINVDQMQERMQQDLDKLQTGSEFLKYMDEQDDRIAAIHRGLDEAIAECEEFDGLLTLYSVELDTLTPDIAYIEAQSQGLQVMAANQKLLQAELKSLLDTISISSEQLACLHEAPLESPRGVEEIETALVKLFKAMITIDPSLGLAGARSSEEGSLRSGQTGGYGNSEIGSMRVLQEKKEVYKHECARFLDRLKQFLQIQFGAAIDETRKALEREKSNNLTRSAGKVKLDPRNHDLSRALLWKYSPLMLFSRDVNRLGWEDIMKSYEVVCKGLYQDEFRDAVFMWKRVARKPTGDEGDILFTSQVEKQTEGIATTARKLTVKRSQTLAKSLRSPGSDSSKTSVDKVADGRLHPYEVFAGALDEMVPIVSMEQNFIVEFFHITSLEQHDFPDAVALLPPDIRRGGDLKRLKVMDPNRDLARLVVQSMEDIYSFFPADLGALVDWALQADPLQGVGLIAAIERKLNEFEETSQEFLARALQKLHARLVGLFSKFLDEQIRAIEETKVKIKKRKGVIAFIRIFPSFSAALENMLASSGDLEIRQTVNKAYIRINKAMFECLKVIARENPSAQTAGADPEDKEAINYQILLIENMYHYLEEVEDRSNSVLEDWKQNALQEMDEHMSLYLGAVVRRPLGKLLDFLESTESLMLSRQPGESSSRISAMPSHSKQTIQKVLAAHDTKEIKKGIEGLKRRIEKHFGDADEPGSSRNLVAKVLLNCEKYYEQLEERILTISRDVYDADVSAQWSRADVSQAFRGISK